MIRIVTLSSVLCSLMAAPPAELFAQFNPYTNGSNGNGSGADPRLRRAEREKAVAIVGPNSREFVEAMGDEAVAAIFTCSKPVAAKLAEFYMSGEMRKLPRPRELLAVIAQPRHGDDVALWAIQHARELTDTDSLDAYLFNPLEYALGLKQLAAGAAEARARRLNLAAATPVPLSRDEKMLILVGVGIVLIVLALLWRRRQSRFPT